MTQTMVKDPKPTPKPYAAEMVRLGRSADPEREFRSREEAVLEAVSEQGSFPLPLVEGPEPSAAELARLEARARDLLNDEILDEEAPRAGALLHSHPSPDGSQAMVFENGETVVAVPVGSLDDHHWCLAPGPVDPHDLVLALSAFRRHLLVLLAPALKRAGLSDPEIEDAARGLKAKRLLWPDEVDPLELADTFPMVLWIENDTPLEREFFCGIDPFAEQTQPYDWA